MNTGSDAVAWRATLSAVVDDKRRFRRVAGCLPTGVAVVTTLAGQTPHAMTANSFTTISLEPLLISVSVDLSSRMSPLLQPACPMAVTVLAADQCEASHRFADPARPMGASGLQGLVWTTAVTGCPVLGDGVVFFDGEVTRRVPAGDHVIVIARVLDFGELRAEARPLVYWKGGYTAPRAHPVPAPRDRDSPARKRSSSPVSGSGLSPGRPEG